MLDGRRTGRRVIVVSSGAVASGLLPLGLRSMPRAIVEKQAAAAVGQQVLMQAWADALRKEHVTVAQVLLTADDLDHRTRYLNARHTLQTLLHHGVLNPLSAPFWARHGFRPVLTTWELAVTATT